MSSKNLSRRGFLAKTGLALGAAALGQMLPEGIVRLAGRRGLWLPNAYADAGLLGPSLPIVTAVKMGNYLQFLILSELYANKGIVNAADNDRFVFEAQANFFNAQAGGFISGTGVQEFGVQPDTDSELRKGSTIKVVPLTLTIPAETAAFVETVLRGGSSVTYQVTTLLVLSDAAGGRHYLDSLVTTGSIVPALPTPTITPTQGIADSEFTINDPQGRMANAQVIKFTKPNQDPQQGTSVQAPTFSPDGTNASGKVPVTPEIGVHGVTVHNGDPALFAPVFAALPFVILEG